MQGVMIANDMVTVPWPYLLVVYLVLMTVFVWCMIFLSGVFGVSHCICLVHDILKWATRRCSSPLFTWQPWKQVSQHQHRCFQSVIIIIIVIVILIIAIVIIFFVISVILAFYWLFRINCLNLRLRNFPNYWLLRLLLKLSDAQASLDPT